jgi:periplasmic divalent cation tolerance protein
VSPYPVGPARAAGPMRLVLSAYPSRDVALAAVTEALARKLVACASLAAVESRYWWEGKVESANEVLVVYKTVPKRVGALFRFVRETHPYRVPEVIELDVPRVEPGYLDYLSATLDPSSQATAIGRHPRRRGAPRAPAARHPRRTRGKPRRRSRRTGRRSPHRG